MLFPEASRLQARSRDGPSTTYSSSVPTSSSLPWFNITSRSITPSPARPALTSTSTATSSRGLLLSRKSSPTLQATPAVAIVAPKREEPVMAATAPLSRPIIVSTPVPTPSPPRRPALVSTPTAIPIPKSPTLHPQPENTFIPHRRSLSFREEKPQSPLELRSLAYDNDPSNISPLQRRSISFKDPSPAGTPMSERSELVFNISSSSLDLLGNEQRANTLYSGPSANSSVLTFSAPRSLKRKSTTNTMREGSSATLSTLANFGGETTEELPESAEENMVLREELGGLVGFLREFHPEIYRQYSSQQFSFLKHEGHAHTSPTSPRLGPFASVSQQGQWNAGTTPTQSAYSTLRALPISPPTSPPTLAKSMRKPLPAFPSLNDDSEDDERVRELEDKIREQTQQIVGLREQVSRLSATIMRLIQTGEEGGYTQ